MASSSPSRWLLFFHQLPPQPASLRVKVWRRLASIGAVLLKNSVYALPNTDSAREDLQWLLQEIEGDGGEGSICQAVFIDGLTDEQVIAMFQEARSADYAAFMVEAAKLEDAPATSALADQIARLRRRLAEIVGLDFFTSPARESAEALVDGLESRARIALDSSTIGEVRHSEYQGRVWSTRAGIYVDRITSAWLIRRFIDPKARFRFLARGEKPRPHDVSFDLAGGEFTHVGNRCTFEVLLDRFVLDDAGLRLLGDVVHDLDIKDGKYARAETEGIAAAISGITLTHREDEQRLDAGFTLCDQLLIALRHQHTQSKKPKTALKK